MQLPTIFLSFLLLTISSGLNSQTLINGGLDGTENWNGIATSWESAYGSPDLMTIPCGLSSCPTYTATSPVNSSEGGTFQMMADGDNEGTTEALIQTVSGFVVGQSYTITYQEANFGPDYFFTWIDTGEWIITVSDIGSMTSGNILPVANEWQCGCVSFVATSTTHSIELSANWLGGTSSGCWIAIDDVQVNPGSFCTDSIDCDMIVASIQAEEKIELNLFPNPSNGLLNLNASSKINEVLIQDQRGRTVYSETIDENVAEFNLEFLESGVYFVSILMEDGRVELKKWTVD